MDLLSGKILLDKNMKLIPAEKILNDTKILIYYFSAKFVESTKIIKKLKNIIEYLCNVNDVITVVYVSFDKYEKDFHEDFIENHGPWFAIQYQDIVITELQYKYSVTCLPRIVVVKKNGEIISSTAKRELEEYGLDAIVKWSYCDD